MLPTGSWKDKQTLELKNEKALNSSFWERDVVGARLNRACTKANVKLIMTRIISISNVYLIERVNFEFKVFRPIYFLAANSVQCILH